MMENAAIALGDSLAPVPWHLRVNLGTKDHYYTSVLRHPRQREGLRILERCFEERIINQRSIQWTSGDESSRQKTGLHRTI